MLRKFIIFINVILVLGYLISNTTLKDTNIKPSEPIRGNETQIAISMLISEGIDDISAYQTALSVIPTNILQEFNTQKWTLHIVNSIESGVSGYTDYENKKIVLNNTYIGQIQGCLIHEFGHFFDYTKGFPSNSDKFMALYESNKGYIECEYKDSLDSIPEEELLYASSSEKELFATIFKEYILNKTYLRKNYIELYEFIKVYF
jgi:hypothetical protein